jgi:fructose-bisphosphate aldolase class II
MLMNMKDILAVAKEHKFAIPAFNVSSWAMFIGIMDLVEETDSPVILEIHPDELSYTGPDFVAGIRERALKSPVPVCIHLDHCSDFGKIIFAIQNGFTSVMFDGAHLPFEENIAGAKKVVEAAHPCNVSVEAELGTIGTTNPDEMEGGAAKIIYTDPDDAAKFVEASGVDTLAVAIGTCHGLYPAGMKPELKLDILKAIEAKVDVPLVLHGGSNNPDKEIGESVTLGICKINISSDIKVTYFEKMREVLQNKGLREPMEICPACIEAMKVVAKHKLDLFQTTGKASLYK